MRGLVFTGVPPTPGLAAGAGGAAPGFFRLGLFPAAEAAVVELGVSGAGAEAAFRLGGARSSVSTSLDWLQPILFGKI